MAEPRGHGDGWELVSASGLRRVYRLLCHVAHCDHELHPKERSLLERYRARFGIGETEASLLEEEGKRKEIRLGKHSTEQHLLLCAMIDVAAADGRLEPREHKRLVKVAGAMGLPQAELVAMIRRRFAHDRAGLPPRPPGVRTAVVPQYRAERREIPDTFVDTEAVPPAPTIPPTFVDRPLERPSERRGAERTVPPTMGEMHAPRGIPPTGEVRVPYEPPRRAPPTVNDVPVAEPPPTEEGYSPFASSVLSRATTEAPAADAFLLDDEVGPDPFAPAPPPSTDPFARPTPGAVIGLGDTRDDDEGPSPWPPAGRAVSTVAADVPREVIERAEADTPRPDPDDEPTHMGPPFSPPRADIFGAIAGDTSLSLSPGSIVLLGLNARELRIDLTSVANGPEKRGFEKVPPGLHWLSVPLGDGGAASLWVDLPGGGVVVKMFDARARRLVDPAPATLERYRGLATAGGLAGALIPYPYDHAVDWVELTVHLDPQRFPPLLHPQDLELGDPGATRLETAIKGTHRGDGQGFLTELSWAFLAGALERHPAALERWLFLLKACFEAEPALLMEDPAVAVLLVDLLVAQLNQMPATFFDIGITTGLADLGAALRATSLSHLHEAAHRLRDGVEAARAR